MTSFLKGFMKVAAPLAALKMIKKVKPALKKPTEKALRSEYSTMKSRPWAKAVSKPTVSTHGLRATTQARARGRSYIDIPDLK